MNDSSRHRDTLYAKPTAPGKFVFDDRVATVFDDMIARSVPGYATILEMVGMLAARYCQDHSRIYDLGCSLGGAALAMAERVACKDCRLIAVDNSSAMIRRLEQRLAAGKKPALPIECRCEDLLDTELQDASVVVLNFTLQFIAPPDRDRLVKRIHAGMRPGGIVIISEKVLFPVSQVNALMVRLHHGFKESMGYSELEISRKRTALEQVLVPESIDAHQRRLREAGFHSVDVWFQCFNFVSMVALKA